MKQKIDVLFLCQYFYPEYITSATLPFDTAEAFVRSGLSVGAMCGYPVEYNNVGKVKLKEVHKGIEIRRLKYLQLKRSRLIGRLINFFSFTFKVALNFRHFSNYKSIIVYSNPPVLPLIAVLANRIYGLKVVFVSYDVYPETAQITKSISSDGIISKMMKFINKKVFSSVSKVVALSSEMRDFLLKHRSDLSPSKLMIIPNWCNDNILLDSKHITLKMLKKIRKDSELIVSYFGNLGICQDLDTFFDAIQYFKDDLRIHFVFAGHGSKMNILKSKVLSNNLENVTVLDFLHGSDFHEALTISDCFLLSLADGVTGLGVPSKTYSYMMAGKPIIAIIGEESDIANDLIENNAGYSMRVGESSKIIDAIKELLDNKEQIEIMGNNSRNIFLKKYTKEICTKQYVEMMKILLEG